MKNLLVVAVVLSGSVACSGAAIRDRELSLGGVALGDSETQVLAALGQPKTRTDTGEGVALEYSGLTVLIGWLDQAAPGKQQRVFQLTATGPNACTPSGICPGAPVSRAVAIYGQPVRAARQSGSFLEYYSNQSSCWLQVGASGDTIRSIGAVCQP